MIKKQLVFGFGLLFLLSLVSCNPKLKNDPEDTLFILNVDISLRPEAKFYLVYENAESVVQSFQMSNFYIILKKRGDLVKGNTINLHFVLLNELEDNQVEIKSFYEVPLGKEIIITDDNLKNATALSSTVNLSFSNMPSFDIVSRTALNSGNAFTLNTFETPVTTAAAGGETFAATELFYACFQTGSTAAYKLERIPAQTSYTVNFGTLNSNVLKYSLPKIVDGVNMVHADVQAYDNPSLYGKYVELYNLNDFSLFPSTTFDVFIPSGERQLGYFVQNYRFETTAGTRYSSWNYSTSIDENIALLNGNLQVSEQTGAFPTITSSPEAYDIAQINFSDHNFSWTLYGPNTSGFYFPEIPAGILSEFSTASSFAQQMLEIDGGDIILTDYSHLQKYEDVLDIYFQQSDQSLKLLDTKILTEEASFSF